MDGLGTEHTPADLDATAPVSPVKIDAKETTGTKKPGMFSDISAYLKTAMALDTEGAKQKIENAAVAKDERAVAKDERAEVAKEKALHKKESRQLKNLAAKEKSLKAKENALFQEHQAVSSNTKLTDTERDTKIAEITTKTAAVKEKQFAITEKQNAIFDARTLRDEAKKDLETRATLQDEPELAPSLPTPLQPTLEEDGVAGPDAPVTAKTAKPTPANIDVIAKGPKTTMGADYSDIVLGDNSYIKGALKVALQSKLLAQNTQLPSRGDRSTRGGNAQHLAAKGVEVGVHGIASMASEIAGWAVLLPAAGLDHLVGSLNDVQETYHTMVEKFGGEENMVAIGAARVIQGTHFIAWIMKNIAVLAAAGLTMAINASLFAVDKLVSGTVALTVNGVAAAARFVGRHPIATAIVTAILTGVGLALKYGLPHAHFAISGAGIVAALPYVGMAVAGLLGLYLVVRTIRGAYDHCPTMSGHDNRFHQMLRQEEFLPGKLEEVTRSDQFDGSDIPLSQGDLIKANRHYVTYLGNEAVRKLTRVSVDKTHARVIKSSAKEHANALASDVAATFTKNWKTARDDLTITRRSLIKATDAELLEAIADYNVDETIEEKDINSVKQALLLSLRAGQAVANHEYVSRIAAAKRTPEQTAKILGKKDLEENRTIIKVLSGSDTEILAAVNKHAKIADGAELTTDFILCVTEALEATEIDLSMKKIELERGAKDMHAKAKTMVSSLFGKKSTFVRFLEQAHYTVAFNDDHTTVSVTKPDDDRPTVAFNLPTKDAPFDERMFNAIFNVLPENEITAKTTLFVEEQEETVIVEDDFVAIPTEDEAKPTTVFGKINNPTAVELVSAFGAYSKLSTKESIKLRFPPRAPSPTDKVQKGDQPLVEPVSGAAPVGADLLPPIAIENMAMKTLLADDSGNPDLVEYALAEEAAKALVGKYPDLARAVEQGHFVFDANELVMLNDIAMNPGQEKVLIEMFETMATLEAYEEDSVTVDADATHAARGDYYDTTIAGIKKALGQPRATTRGQETYLTLAAEEFAAAQLKAAKLEAEKLAVATHLGTEDGADAHVDAPVVTIGGEEVQVAAGFVNPLLANGGAFEFVDLPATHQAHPVRHGERPVAADARPLDGGIPAVNVVAPAAKRVISGLVTFVDPEDGAVEAGAINQARIAAGIALQEAHPELAQALAESPLTFVEKQLDAFLLIANAKPEYATRLEAMAKGLVEITSDLGAKAVDDARLAEINTLITTLEFEMQPPVVVDPLGGISLTSGDDQVVVDAPVVRPAPPARPYPERLIRIENPDGNAAKIAKIKAENQARREAATLITTRHSELSNALASSPFSYNSKQLNDAIKIATFSVDHATKMIAMVESLNGIAVEGDTKSKATRSFRIATYVGIQNELLAEIKAAEQPAAAVAE